MNKQLTYILVSLQLLLITGCLAQPGSRRELMTSKAMADRLETLPSGITAEQLFAEFPELKRQSGRFYPVTKFSVCVDLGWDPCNETNETQLYRQWPHGVLIDLDTNDFRIYVDVADSKPEYNLSKLEVFFSSDMHYLGYFARSLNRNAADSEKRLATEKESFKQLGLIEESKYVRALTNSKWTYLEQMSIMPNMPLRKHIQSHEFPLIRSTTVHKEINNISN